MGQTKKLLEQMTLDELIKEFFANQYADEDEEYEAYRERKEREEQEEFERYWNNQE